MSNFDANIEMGWEDTIHNEGAPFQTVPEGDYYFVVEKFERARHSGSEKIPPCNKAILTLAISNPEHCGKVITTLFLFHSVQWKLFQFFTSIGQCSSGDEIKMNWSLVPGAKGRCHVGIRSWSGNDGKQHQNNEVTEFLAPENQPVQPAGSSPKYTAGQF